MDIIKKLRNYFIGLLTISIGLSALMIVLGIYNLKIPYIEDSLINTIIASFYAVTIAVFIYWRQQKDKYDSLKSSLINFLNKFKLDLKNDKFTSKLFVDVERESKINFCRNIISNSIQSGLLNDKVDELLEYQSKIDQYYSFLDLALVDLDDEDLEKEFLEIENISLSDITNDLINKLE